MYVIEKHSAKLLNTIDNWGIEKFGSGSWLTPFDIYVVRSDKILKFEDVATDCHL